MIIFSFFFFTGKGEGSREASVLKENKDIQVTLEDKQEKTEKEPSTIFVEVKGAVRKPGVYTFQSDARVEEAIQRAGGFTSKADTIEINQAAKLEDSMMIYVRKQGKRKERRKQYRLTHQRALKRVRVSMSIRPMQPNCKPLTA